MHQLGKSLKDIPFDKIYKGMKVAFKSNLHNTNYVPGIVISTKKSCPVTINYDNVLTDFYDVVELEIEHGPIYAIPHKHMSNIFYLE